VVALLVAGCGEDGASASDEYPNRTIDLIVPYAAGGGTSEIARVVSDIASRHMDVELRDRTLPGEGGATGTRFVTEAEPDGYTVLFGTPGSVVTAPHLQDTGYTWQDLSPVALMSSTSLSVVVGAESPHETFADLVEFSRANPGAVTYGTSGAGSSSHVAAAALAHSLGVEWSHVPFDGSSEALIAAAGGHIDFSIPSTGSATSQIENGLLRPLAVTSAERSPRLPDVPTLVELGYEDQVYPGWRGVFVPAGTPEDRIAYLEDILRQVSEDPEFVEAVTALEGEPPVFVGAADTRAQIEAEDARLAPVLETLRNSS
jgi:tripartite-type tricarboxylate transporter receptor subunit TctC